MANMVSEACLWIDVCMLLPFFITIVIDKRINVLL